MSTRIAFLRAVNVGKRTVSMARLVEIFEALGFRDVWTFINSGNVVFDATGARADLEDRIATAMEAEYGFECTTYVRSPAELRRLLDAAPFEVAADDTYFVLFAKDRISPTVAAALEACSNDMDTLVVDGRDVHWRMHGRSVDTTLGKQQWGLLGEPSGTSRNVTSLRKLVAKLER